MQDPATGSPCSASVAKVSAQDSATEPPSSSDQAAVTAGAPGLPFTPPVVSPSETSGVSVSMTLNDVFSDPSLLRRRRRYSSDYYRLWFTPTALGNHGFKIVCDSPPLARPREHTSAAAPPIEHNPQP